MCTAQGIGPGEHPAGRASRQAMLIARSTLLLTAVVLLSIAASDSAAVESPSSEVVVVSATNSYEVKKSTHVYARGLVHEEWGDKKGTETDLLLDLYVPDGAEGPHPAAILIHGGGFVGGSREFSVLSSMAETLASRGWVCVSVDYRLAGDRGSVPEQWSRYVDNQDAPLSIKQREQALAIYPASRDVKAALRWLTAHAAAYSIDVSRVTALGGSAGAILAVMLGATEPEDYRDELSLADDPTLRSANLDAPSKVHTVVDFWGSAIAVQLYEDVWGQPRFGESDAPLLIIHGTEDPTVSYEKALELEAIWQSNDVPYELRTLVGAGHGAWNRTLDGLPLIEIAFDFIVRHQQLLVVQ